MSLEKRFQKLFNGQVVNENRVKGSVQICDEFAVGFSEWKVGLLTKQVDGKFYFDYNAKWVTTTELLEIYKQGL